MPGMTEDGGDDASIVTTDISDRRESGDLVSIAGRENPTGQHRPPSG